MKPGKTLQQLVDEIERQDALKRDVVVSVKSLDLTPDNKLVVPAGKTYPGGAYAMTEIFQGQVAREIKYPYEFWQRSREQFPDQWRELVKAMINSGNDRRLIRTLGDDARAYLSNSYRIIDNGQIATAALGTVKAAKNWRVVSSEITDRKMYIKVVTETEGEIRKGDIVRAGFVLTNSEIGEGAVSVLPLVERLACLNGMVINVASMRKTHLTRAQIGDGSAAFEYSDKSNRLADQTLLSQLSDVIRKTVSSVQFDQLLNRYRTSAEQHITGHMPEVVEVTAQRFGLAETEKQSVLRNLIEGMDYTQYGLIQAVTATAQDDEIDYARSVELETIGGDILNLPAREWISISASEPKTASKGKTRRTA
jgi:hypothetical protein